MEYFVDGYAWLGVVRLGLAELDLNEVPDGGIDGGDPAQSAVVATGQKIRRQRLDDLGWCAWSGFGPGRAASYRG